MSFFRAKTLFTRGTSCIQLDKYVKYLAQGKQHSINFLPCPDIPVFWHLLS